MTKRFFICILVLFSFFQSCGKDKVEYLDREELFSIRLGQMPDELNFLITDDYHIQGTSELVMEDGIFFISGSGNGKVMELTSYGDLLTLIYNQENSTPYVQELEATDNEDSAGRIVKNWPFRKINNLEITDQYVLVGDVLAEDKMIWSEEEKVNLSNILLRFDKDGNFVDYLGQEGIGTIPFPLIMDLTTRINNEIVVTTRTNEKWIIFWFNENGDLLYRIEFSDENLPFYKENMSKNLYEIKPDPEEYSIHLQIDYLPVKEVSNQQPETRLYTFDLLQEDYNKGIAVPDNERIINNAPYLVPYIFLGTTVNDAHFFLSPVDSKSYNLLITGKDSSIISQRKLRIKSNDILYHDFYLSPEGILCMIAFYPDRSQIYWWRADKLINGNINVR